MRPIVLVVVLAAACVAAPPVWTPHEVATNFRTNTAVAADFTGDGKVDIIANCGPCKEDVLFVAPDWKRVTLQKGRDAIHAAVLDMDGDGDLDYVGAVYSPGFLYWLERPKNPLSETWTLHVLDDSAKGGINGIHGLTTGDVNRDGKADLIANSAQPGGAAPNSLVWFEAPGWKRHIFADKDAPGLSHYLGFGDVNGDGRPDIAAGAKAPDGGNWFAWWEQPAGGAAGVWKRHWIGLHHEGATNIAMADVNRDGRMDFIATRGHGNGVLWFEAPGWRPHDIDAKLVGPHSLAVGDIDRDGDLDAVTCAKDSRIAAWFENDGKGGFRTHVIARDQAAYDIRLVDMDGDGDLDVLVAGQETRNVIWFENRPGGAPGR